MPALYLHDIYYNTLMLFNDPFGLLASSDHALLQNKNATNLDGKQVWVDVKDQYTSLSLEDPGLQPAQDGYNAGVHIWANLSNEEEYNRSMKEGSLLGLGFFPWSTRVLRGVGKSEGHYLARHRYETKGQYSDYQRFNEWSGDLLWMKLGTIGKVGALSAVGWYGGKYLYKKYA